MYVMPSSLNSTLACTEASQSPSLEDTQACISADVTFSHNDTRDEEAQGACKSEEWVSLPNKPVSLSLATASISMNDDSCDNFDININSNSNITAATPIEISPRSKVSMSSLENANEDEEDEYKQDSDADEEDKHVSKGNEEDSSQVDFGPPSETLGADPATINSVDNSDGQRTAHLFSNYFRMPPEPTKQRWVSNYHHASLTLDSGSLLRSNSSNNNNLSGVNAHDAGDAAGVMPWRQSSDSLQGWVEMCSGGCSLRRNVTGSHILLITEENTVPEEPLLSASCANCLLLRSTLCLPHGRAEACFSAQVQQQQRGPLTAATGARNSHNKISSSNNNDSGAMSAGSSTYLGMGFAIRVNEELRGFHMVLIQLHSDGTATVSVGVWRVTERDVVMELRVVCAPQLVRLAHDRLHIRLVAREGEFDVFMNDKKLNDEPVPMPGLRLKEARALLFNTGGAVTVRNIALSQGDRPPESRVFASAMYVNAHANNSASAGNAKSKSPEFTNASSSANNNTSGSSNNNSSLLNWNSSRKTQPVSAQISKNSPPRPSAFGTSPPIQKTAQSLAGMRSSTCSPHAKANYTNSPVHRSEGNSCAELVSTPPLTAASRRPVTADANARRESLGGATSSSFSSSMPCTITRRVQQQMQMHHSVDDVQDERAESAIHRSNNRHHRNNNSSSSNSPTCRRGGSGIARSSPLKSNERVGLTRRQSTGAETECKARTTSQEARSEYPCRRTHRDDYRNKNNACSNPSPHRRSSSYTFHAAGSGRNMNNDNGSSSKNAAVPRRSGAARASSSSTTASHGTNYETPSDVLPPHIDPALAAVIRAEIMERSPQVSWDDIAGIADAKRLLKEAVLLPIMLPELFVGVVQPWRGVLLYGPPGTGKTMLAKAVATSANTTFFNISSSTLNTKHYGESEKLVRTLFALARHYAPSTIFFDEIDALASARGGGEHEASRRVKSEMLQQMDGLHGNVNATSGDGSTTSGGSKDYSSRATRLCPTGQTHNSHEVQARDADGNAPVSQQHQQQNQRVLVLATTNRPWDLDEAIRRRLEKRIYIPLPDAISRAAMLERYVTHLRLARDVVMDRVVQQTEGYSGADVTIVVRDAAMMPVRRLIDAHSTEEIVQLKAEGRLHVSEVCMADFEAALSRSQSSVAKESLERFEQWTALFGST